MRVMLFWKEVVGCKWYLFVFSYAAFFQEGQTNKAMMAVCQTKLEESSFIFCFYIHDHFVCQDTNNPLLDTMIYSFIQITVNKSHLKWWLCFIQLDRQESHTHTR